MTSTPTVFEQEFSYSSGEKYTLRIYEEPMNEEVPALNFVNTEYKYNIQPVLLDQTIYPTDPDYA